MKIDFGKLTAEQTTNLFREAIAEMSIIDIIKALRDSLNREDLTELIESLDADDVD